MQESLWWFECQRARLLQRSQSGEAGAEGSTAGGWRTEKVILRPDDGDEEEADFRQDRQRPE